MKLNKIIKGILIGFAVAFVGSSSVFSQVPTVITVNPGAAQNWTVPNCVSNVTFTVAGGAGAGNAFGQTGGNGAVITFNMNVTPGDVFQVEAGGAGANPAGGSNGGGNGQTSTIAGYNSGGGGGASTVSTGGNAIAVAAGGGGAGGGDAAGSGGNGGCV
ncbi:MAG: hypothetical protein MK066_08645, partial [Crocinitomicaceae bacterium]|nr:hypothetical protein [Crocinitomicaceae bacterium]